MAHTTGGEPLSTVLAFLTRTAPAEILARLNPSRRSTTTTNASTAPGKPVSSTLALPSLSDCDEASDDDNTHMDTNIDAGSDADIESLYNQGRRNIRAGRLKQEHGSHHNLSEPCEFSIPRLARSIIRAKRAEAERGISGRDKRAAATYEWDEDSVSERESSPGGGFEDVVWMGWSTESESWEELEKPEGEAENEVKSVKKAKATTEAVTEAAVDKKGKEKEQQKEWEPTQERYYLPPSYSRKRPLPTMQPYPGFLPRLTFERTREQEDGSDEEPLSLEEAEQNWFDAVVESMEESTASILQQRQPRHHIQLASHKARSSSYITRENQLQQSLEGYQFQKH